MNADCLRPKELAELEDIKFFIQTVLGKRELLLQAANFMLNDGLFTMLFDERTPAIDSALFFNLLRTTPTRSRKLRLRSIEDVLELIDTTENLELSSAVLLYLYLVATTERQVPKTFDSQVLSIPQ
jgi:hypothetical protein